MVNGGGRVNGGRASLKYRLHGMPYLSSNN